MDRTGVGHRSPRIRSCLRSVLSFLGSVELDDRHSRADCRVSSRTFRVLSLSRTVSTSFRHTRPPPFGWRCGGTARGSEGCRFVGQFASSARSPRSSLISSKKGCCTGSYWIIRAPPRRRGLNAKCFSISVWMSCGPLFLSLYFVSLESSGVGAA